MTLLGQHTAAELRDWLEALDYQVNHVDAAFTAFGPTWQARDPASMQAWLADWKAFRARYDEAHKKAQHAVIVAHANPLAPDAVVPVEEEWQGVHLALAPAPTTTRGDFQDLYNRLAAVRGTPIDLSQTPQPTATDVDLGAYKAAGAVIRAGERAARQVGGGGALVGGLLLAGGAIAVAGIVGLRLVMR